MFRKSSSANRSKRVNRMIACVIASFLVTWTPNHLLTLSMLLIDKNQPWMFYWNSVTQVGTFVLNTRFFEIIKPLSKNMQIRQRIQVFASVSAIANPIIYAFTRGDLRRVGKEWYRSLVRAHLASSSCATRRKSVSSTIINRHTRLSKSLKNTRFRVEFHMFKLVKLGIGAQRSSDDALF